MKDEWQVYVLCAEWCGVCRGYRPFVLEQQAKGTAQQAHWLWVDVETHADVLDDLDIENFPTLLIAQGREPRFFGVVTPQPEVALRLFQSVQTALDSPSVIPPQDERHVQSLLMRLQQADLSAS